ncbi:receptor-like serine/threonine-protein kinase At1g78530 [Papaver somniferum]|uniref:receptor-like serine/threonine-protein kinase At1g78530 n=1 Tax=Papaver somniferum TaxID=3469 RepID=UPI000E7039EE|nr:receptor-like serine/threonine-protein kinase At1g78530 [Papaver somniferum]XP_026397687.1 receptor-like serine/threonine-protein kinase At1g78530 [Papaver somniferum]
MGYMSSKYIKLLVYEYMDNGSLDQWLHHRNIGRTLDWQKRLDIAVRVAQGLSYIHHNCSSPIIHRDVKSSNILLDSEFKAKVADFGLAKIVQAGEPFSASIVAGTFGYIAPEYGRTLKVNEKVDVYSFGVVLLELVTGRKASRGDEDRSCAEWAADRSLETSLDVLLDEEVKEGWKMAEMTSVFRLGLMCTSTSPSNRPTMSEALQYLVRHCSSQEVHEKKALVAAENVAPLLLSTNLG